MNKRIQDIPIMELLSEVKRLESISANNTIASTIVDLYRQEIKSRMTKSTRTISAPFISGYCSCCGAPHFVGEEITHDRECVWYDE